MKQAIGEIEGVRFTDDQRELLGVRVGEVEGLLSEFRGELEANA
ncbi:hypothetical protein [Nocardioides humi]|nr:hypothetical protein [Nocardioides humi]